MLLKGMTRRRVLTIVAAASAAGAGALAGLQPRFAAADFEWRGIAMGADARILFNGIDENAAREATHALTAEIDRLENALSLTRPDSELSRLNRDRVLHSPSRDFCRALELALSVCRATDGLFDPTVQSLWETHVDWFSAHPDAALPPENIIVPARSRIDWRRILIDANRVSIGSGQHLTLNGMGQGYVTDRVAELLRARGIRHVFVDLGEQRADEPRADGQPWVISRPGAQPFTLLNGALATSEGAGCILGAGGAAHHLFDPRTGRSASTWKRITVYHRTAALADALSTALHAASAQEIETIVARQSGVAVWAVDQADRESQWIDGPVPGINLGIS